MEKNELIKAIADAIDKRTNDLNDVEVMICQIGDLIDMMWDETTTVRDIEEIGEALMDAKDKKVKNVDDLCRTVYRFLSIRDQMLSNWKSLSDAWDIYLEVRKLRPCSDLIAEVKPLCP